MTTQACRHVSSPEYLGGNIALNLHHNNITVYLNISVPSAIISDPFYDLHTTIAFMTEQQKAGYHIISEAEDVEDGKEAIRKFDLKDSTETIRKFLTEDRGVKSPSETHTFYFRKNVPIPEEAKGILWTYPPEKIPGTMEFGVWYPESNFTIIRKRKTGPAEVIERRSRPAVVILWDFSLQLEVPPETKTIKSFIVFRNS